MTITDKAVLKRQAVERRVARAAVRSILAAGHMISVCDGEDYPLTRSRDERAIMKALMSTDGDTLVIRAADGTKLGWVALVYGNDGWDVISDYSANDVTEALLAPAHAAAEKIERRAA